MFLSRTKLNSDTKISTYYVDKITLTQNHTYLCRFYNTLYLIRAKTRQSFITFLIERIGTF